MNDYTFGNFLYTLRSEKELSQAQLGEMLGVTNKAVSKWENGSAKPNTALIPQIAEIFGITVEELFACKRFEKDSEYEKIKNYLSIQKRKYAILSSVFLSALVTLPLFLIEFICIITGFDIPDDVTGPLGAVCFIFAFIISITAYVIYHKNFKQAFTPTDSVYPSRFIQVIKNGRLFSAITWWCIFALLLSIYLLFSFFSYNFPSANILLVIASFILILLFGTFICFANIKRLLKLKFSEHVQKEKKRIRFSELPMWVKICRIAVIVLYPIILSIQIQNNGWLFIKFLFTLMWFGSSLAIIIYTLKKK